MINPKCDICKQELEDFGSLLFSPPGEDGKTDKRHICKSCYGKLILENNL